MEEVFVKNSNLYCSVLFEEGDVGKSCIPGTNIVFGKMFVKNNLCIMCLFGEF